MANILLLTSVYPLAHHKLYGSTDVCHFFAREWILLGHKVKVVFNYTIYPELFHTIGEKLGSKIANIFPVLINDIRYDKAFEYNYEGVEVFLNPILKWMPKIPFFKAAVKNNAQRTFEWLECINFKPDVIVGHFLHPSLEIIDVLKNKLNCKAVVIMHGKARPLLDRIPLNKYADSINLWGYRSVPIMSSYSKYISNNK